MSQGSPTRREMPTPLVADEDLSTPVHDAIMMWLDANIADVLPGAVAQTGKWRFAGTGWSEREVAEAKEACSRHWGVADNAVRAAMAAGVIGPEPRSEAPWSERRQRIDSASRWTRQQGEALMGTAPPDPGDAVGKRTWEFPVARSGGFIIGYIDLAVETLRPFLDCHEGRLSVSYMTRGTVHFEVKSRIRSVGEVIRQIRAYETVLGAGTCVVVCPDDRFAETIKGQRIAFVKAPPEALALR